MKRPGRRSHRGSCCRCKHNMWTITPFLDNSLSQITLITKIVVCSILELEDDKYIKRLHYSAYRYRLF